MSIELRDYQHHAIENLRNGLRAGNLRQVLSLPTAGGKTVVAAQMIKTAMDKGLRCWFVVDGIDLVDQTLETFEDFGIDAGVIQGINEKTAYNKQVQVVTAQTITRRWNMIDKNPQWRPQLIIADEIHVFYKAHREMIGMFKTIPFIGITATPFTKGMGKIFTNLVIGSTTEELMEQGYLCNYTPYGCKSPDLKGINTVAGDYNQGQLEERVNTKEINGDVVSTWKRLGENRQTIVFTVSVAHSEELAREFNANGVSAIHIDGYTDKDERKEKIAQFKAGEVKVFCNCQIAIKGFNAPLATCLVDAKPTRSKTMHVQKTGRILRISPCGKDAIILDHADNIKRLGFVEDIKVTELDMGEKVDNTEKKKEAIEKEISAPKPCSNCGFLFSGSITCPNCGNTYIKDSNVIQLEGELKKLERKKKTPAEKRNMDTSKQDKQAFYSAALGHAIEKGFKEGWAANQYKERYGVWPNAMNKYPGPITDEFSSHLTAQRIRYAHRRK